MEASSQAARLVKIDDQNNGDRFIVLDPQGFTQSSPMTEAQTLHWLSDSGAAGDHDEILDQARSASGTTLTWAN